MATDNQSPQPWPRTIAIYRRLIRLYPKSYQAQYAPLALQLVRDLCRESARDSHKRRGGPWRLWLRLLPDFLITLCQEHFTEWKGKLAMKKWSDPKSLSLLLLLAGLGLGAVSLALMIMPRLSLGLMHVTVAVFLVRAVAEWFRPHGQWVWSLLNGFIVAVAFGCFLPAWAKIAHEHDLRHLIMPALVMGVLGMNLGVPALKAAIHLVRKPHSRCVVP